MKIIEPVTIADGNYLSSNVVEDLPRAAGGTTYNQWDSATAYSVGNVVCNTYSYYNTTVPYYVNERFGIFTCLVANTSIFPGNSAGGTYNPSSTYWRLDGEVVEWDSVTTYSQYAVTGYSNGTTGAFYYSKVSANINHIPPSSSTQWQQTSPSGYATYAGGTTYAINDQVAIFTGTLAQVYKSLQNSNTGHAPASSPTWWEYLGATYSQWNSGTTYAAGNIVIDLRTHRAYESLAGSNLNKDPTSSANSAWWLDTGTNNKWAMFDLSNTSASSMPDELDTTVQLSSSVDSLCLLNLLATQVQVICSTSGGGTLYSHTIDLTNQGDATANRKYFYDADTNSADLILTDIPTNADLMVQFIITNTGAFAQCGVAVFGTADDVGGTIYDASIGIISFSRKVADDFGNYTLVQRANSKRGSFKIAVEPTDVDRVTRKLARLDATPTVFIGSGDYSSTWVFGFYRDFSMLIAYPTVSYLSLEIEGLT